ncbi:GH1 family beta-glucosidase [Limnohabitans sp. Rim8]|uniref:GH1 family beta-glucosidase n=1 Tax=Limnohabitans sp. Rim8 TaxID=1100718 RepID=UPI0025FB9A69|nr:GH1 family beta-glucosidase [Limnohabitans sp. Rim8]
MSTMTVSRDQFPQDFKWGVATSSFQIEGAHDRDGKGPSIWDTFCATDGKIADASNGHVACEHYTRWPEDVELITRMGVNAYRFSMSWPRVQPDGQSAWNEAGFAFYDQLISALAQRGIELHLTLNHWDLPQSLQDQGGWANREVCAHFTRYATEVARRFGHRVHSICTHNEPWVIAILGYEQGIFAPGIQSRKQAMQAVHHLLLSHGMALQAMRGLGLATAMGIVLNLSPIYPASDDPLDVAKAKLDDGLILRLYMDALFKGVYPQDVIEHLGADAPPVQPGDLATIAQPNDFLGVNYYTRNFSSCGNPWDVASTGNTVTDMGWEVYPQGLTVLLCRLHKDYQPQRLWVTENGAAFKDQLVNGVVDDAQRLAYIRDHIAATHDAMATGVPVGAYFAWSLMDNFEWASGYAKRFGLVHVDFETQQRTFKNSALWYQKFLSEK